MKSQTSKLILVLASIVLVVFLSALSVMIYMIVVKNRETSRLLNEADSAARKEVINRGIRIAQNQSKEDIDTLTSLVLTENEIVPFIESMENAGQSLGLETKVLSVDKMVDEKTKKLPYEVHIKIETRGSWSGTYGFLRALENLPTRITMSASEMYKESDGWRLSASFIVYLFE